MPEVNSNSAALIRKIIPCEREFLEEISLLMGLTAKFITRENVIEKETDYNIPAVLN